MGWSRFFMEELEKTENNFTSELSENISKELNKKLEKLAQDRKSVV